MDVEILNALRSPAGIPGPAAIFLALLVVTWTLHMLSVQIMLGTLTLALIGHFKPGANWARLRRHALETSKIAVSIAIVLGVAPLLFLQVIYDPFWYVSNVLSGRWVCASIFMLLIGYYALYQAYFSEKNHEQAKLVYIPLAVALALLLLFGWVIHGLSVQMLEPEHWMQWYAPEGHIDPRGTRIHQTNPARFFYFTGLSIPVTAAWLSAHARFLETQENECEIPNESQSAHIAWLQTLYPPLFTMGGFLTLALYSIWMATLPDSAHDFPKSVWSWMAIGGTLLIWSRPTAKPGYQPLMIASASMLLIAISREALRLRILSGGHGYDINTYPVHTDGYGLVLFFFTLGAFGIPAIGYLVGLAWHHGQRKSNTEYSAFILKLGKISLYGLSAWIIQYFVMGGFALIRG